MCRLQASAENGIKTELKREYSPRRVRRKVGNAVSAEDTRRGRGFHRVTIDAARRMDETIVKKISPYYQKTMKSDKFEARVTEALLPVIKSGSTLIMYNARFHRKDKLIEIGKTKNINILFLPPYSPGFNLIEKSWANSGNNRKHYLRDAAPCYELLETAVYNYW